MRASGRSEESQTERKDQEHQQSDACVRACVLRGSRRRTPSTMEALGTGWLHSGLYSVPPNLFAGTGWDREQRQLAKLCTQSSESSPLIVRLNTGGRGSALLKCGDEKEAQCGEQRAPRAKGSRAVCFVGVPLWESPERQWRPRLCAASAIPPTLLSSSDPCWSETNRVSGREASGQRAQVSTRKTTAPCSVINTSSRGEIITNHIRKVVIFF